MLAQCKALGHRPSTVLCRAPRTLRPCKAAAQKQNNETISSLDALIGGDNAAASSSGRTAADAADDGRVLWWQARPSQTAPPRQTSFSKAEGRFINEDVLGLGGSRRAGRPTPVGGELDLPTVEPAVAYLVLMCQLAVYAAGTWVGATQGAGAAEQMALELALVPRAVLEDGEWWRLGTSMLLHTGMPHLVLSTFGLGYLAPDAEAVLGHVPFAAVYILSGLTAASCALLLGPADAATAGATGALLGIVGAMAGCEAANSALRSAGGRPARGAAARAASPWGALALAGGALALGLLLPPGPVDSGSAGAQVAGLMAGAWVGYSAGPRFSVTREVDIPEGSMMVPSDANEVTVVVDARGGAAKALAVAGYAAALAGVVAAGGLARAAFL